MLTAVEKPLFDFLQRPDAVIFVGSGLSMFAGLPSWQKLLITLIKSAEARGMDVSLASEALASGDLLDTADKLAPITTPIELVNTMRGELGFASARPHKVHSLLANLGPQRFVTTNYDTLIEQQLGLEGRLGAFRKVTTSQIAELADIQKASADMFVFKPHGDIDDANSIVLSNFHYDRILAGETNQIRRVLELLLISRPTLFLGYGFRDPDTMLILRSLRDRFVGNAGDFRAVMPDATPASVNYWWDTYRVRIHSYTTVQGDHGRDHSKLLGLLARLVNARAESDRKGSVTKRVAGDTPVETQNQALLRYAARLARKAPATEFDISVMQFFGMRTRDYTWSVRSTLAKVLRSKPGNFIIEGPAGSGKSFAVTSYLSDCGNRIVEALMGDEPIQKLTIPVLLDARLFAGDFQALLAVAVPQTLQLAELSATHEICFIVDSIDEMPAEHLESPKWMKKLNSFLSDFSSPRVIYCTRRRDLVPVSDLLAFQIMPLDDDVVSEELEHIGRSVGSLKHDLVQALQSPLLLMLGRRLLGRGRSIATAPALLAAFIRDCIDRTSDPLGFELRNPSLVRLGWSLIESGRETMSIPSVARKLISRSDNQDEARDRVHRLVSSGLLVSEINGTVRFVHRSITEYLASQHLMEQWQQSPRILRPLLEFTRWDNVIAWCAASLPAESLRKFIAQVLAADPLLAIRIAGNAERAQDRLWVHVLDAIAPRKVSFEEDMRIAHQLAQFAIPAGAAHALTRIALKNSSLGGTAAAALIPHISDHEVEHWMRRLVKGEFGFNATQRSGPKIGARLSPPSFKRFLKTFASEVRGLREEELDENYRSETTENIVHALEHIIGGLSPELREQLVVWGNKQPPQVRAVIVWALMDDEAETSRTFIFDQLNRGLGAAIYPSYNILAWHSKSGHVIAASKTLLDRLLTVIRERKVDSLRWAIELLRMLAQKSKEWANLLRAWVKQEPDSILRSILPLILPKVDVATVESFVTTVLSGIGEVDVLTIHIIETLEDVGFKLDERLVLDVLSNKDTKRIQIVVDCWDSYGAELRFLISDIDGWVNALHRVKQEAGALEFHNLCLVLKRVTSTAAGSRLISRVNNPADPMRDFILEHVCWRVPGIDLDRLSTASAKRLVGLLVKKGTTFDSAAAAMSERFVQSYLVPAVKRAKSAKERATLRELLEDAGRRHDRRYWYAFANR